MSEKVTVRGMISLTPEVNKPRSRARRNSTGKASYTVSPSLSISGQKPVPNYLRAFTGSCHDFCKYGIKHGFETKKRFPTSIKFPSNSGTSDEKQYQAKATTPQERRKRPEIKSKLSQALHAHTEEVITQKDLPPEKVIQLSVTPTNQEEGSSGESSGIELKISFPRPTTVASIEHKPANVAEESSKGSITIKLEGPSHIQKSSTPDEHKFPSEGSCEEPVRIQSHALTTQKGIVSAELTPVAQVEESLPTRTGIALAEHEVRNLAEESSEEPEIITLHFQESIASAENAVTDQEEGSSIQKRNISAEYTSADREEGLSEEQNQAKILNAGNGKKRGVNKLRTSQKKVEISVGAEIIKQKTSDASLQKKTASSVKKSITFVKPTSIRQKIPSFVSAEPETSSKHKESASPSISTGGLTGRRNQDKKIIRSPGRSKIGAEEVPKLLKTCVSYLSSNSSLLLSPPSSHNSESTLNEIVSASDEKGTEQRRKAAISKGDNKRIPCRTGRIHPEDKSPTPCNLKFRGGRVVSLQSENNGPRKLEFRQARVLSESHNVKKIGRRNFRKQRESGTAASNTTTSDALDVVLRHQVVQENKDTQCLFNHVIEETASKLVQIRKSRVQALVGAFEAVISLQGNKLAPAVAVP